MKFTVLAPTVVLALSLAACGSSADRTDTPVACLAGPGAYTRAFRSAPGPVLLGGDTPVGDCLPSEQSAGDLATVGSALIAAATDLNTQARNDPGGSANLALGYLLGTVRDAGGPTGGIHADLIRRVDVAAQYSPGGEPLPPAFGIALARGEAQSSKPG